MQVQVLCFGVLRDHLGGTLAVDLPGEGATVGALVEALTPQLPQAVQGLLPKLAIAVNQGYAGRDATLHEGDEVALLPPVSGGTDGGGTGVEAGSVLLTDKPLDGKVALNSLKAGSDGAVVVFDGIVRNNTRGRQTQYLFYEAYEPMALAQMQALVTEACTRFGVRDALLHHRLGRLEISESSVLIAVASAHRGAAFDACRWIIDTLKKTVPIWKKEYFTDGAVWADGEAFPEELLPGAGK